MAEFHEEIFRLKPWYHDFSRLGIQTDFRDRPPALGHKLGNLIRKLAGRTPREYGVLDSNILVNQKCKEQYLIPFIEKALARLPTEPKCLEFFCADGYYSLLIRHLRPDAQVFGVDRDKRAIKLATAMAGVLGYKNNVAFISADVKDAVYDRQPYDLILCAGGLYHLADPRDFITWMSPMAGKFLVVQTVVTLETEDADYFVSPAPGWKHGSRFTHAGIKRWLAESGLSIIEEGRNELEGNDRLCDRGSSYFLCSKG